MLSQRSVAKFELFYAAMLQQPFYGENSLLNVGEYATELYAEGLPNDLLNKLYRKTDFNHPFARALYEGIAVADTLGHYSVSDRDRQLGTVYLLLCMAVAIRFYRSAGYGSQEHVRPYHDALVSSLAEDGYGYSNGKMHEAVTGETIRPVSMNGDPPLSVAPAKPEPVAQEVLAALEIPEAEVSLIVKKRKWLLRGGVTLGLPTFFWVLSIFNGDFHDWLLPKLHSVAHYLARLAS